MSAAEYYSSQQVGQVYTPDNIPLLPVYNQQHSLSTSYQQEHNGQSSTPLAEYSYAPCSTPPSESSYSKPQTNNGSINAQNRLKQRTARLQRAFRYLLALRTLSQSLSTIFSGTMFGMMAFVLWSYFSTKDKTYGGQAAWPQNPKLWPSFMLLVGAAITLIVAVGTLIMYCSSAKGRVRGNWRLILWQYAIHIAVWALITFLYRYEKSLHNIDNDLWGWSCGDVAKKLQQDLGSNIDFDLLCKVQANSFYFSLLETVIKVLFVLVHIYLRRRILQKEKVLLADELGGLASDLIQNLF